MSAAAIHSIFMSKSVADRRDSGVPTYRFYNIKEGQGEPLPSRTVARKGQGPRRFSRIVSLLAAAGFARVCSGLYWPTLMSSARQSA